MDMDDTQVVEVIFARPRSLQDPLSICPIGRVVDIGHHGIKQGKIVNNFIINQESILVEIKVDSSHQPTIQTEINVHCSISTVGGKVR